MEQILVTVQKRFYSKSMDSLLQSQAPVEGPEPHVFAPIESGLALKKDVRYTSRPRITTYIWPVSGVVAIGALVLLLGFPRLILGQGSTLTKSDVISPIAEEASFRQPTTDNRQPNSPYTPSQYIYFSQSYFSDAQTMSQNRQQTDDDKKQILSNLQKALDTISEGITTYPKRSELWAHRATIERALTGISSNALPSAIADMEQAYQLSPQNPDYAKTLSDLYLAALRINSGNPPDSRNFLDKATFYLSQAQQLKPNDSQLLYTLAQLQVKAGQLAAANISFTKLLPLVTDTTQKQKVEQEKQAVEKLLSQAGTSNPTNPTNNPIRPIGGATQPSGLELVPDQQTMSRELVIAESDEGVSPYEDTVAGSAYSGTGVVPKGATNVTIESIRVSATAPIYVAPAERDLASPGTLTVTSKKAGSYFIVTVDAVQEKDVPFNWWILE